VVDVQDVGFTLQLVHRVLLKYPLVKPAGVRHQFAHCRGVTGSRKSMCRRIRGVFLEVGNSG